MLVTPMQICLDDVNAWFMFHVSGAAFHPEDGSLVVMGAWDKLAVLDIRQLPPFWKPPEGWRAPSLETTEDDDDGSLLFDLLDLIEFIIGIFA